MNSIQELLMLSEKIDGKQKKYNPKVENKG
jgi:hypothetical protein